MFGFRNGIPAKAGTAFRFSIRQTVQRPSESPIFGFNFVEAALSDGLCPLARLLGAACQMA